MTRYRLTDKQRPVYEFIKRYLDMHQRAPYIHEIQDACGIRSYKSAIDRLVALERKQFITRVPNKHRSITLLEAPQDGEQQPLAPLMVSVTEDMSRI